MKIILLQDDKKLGKKGAVVEVNEGFARNFIIPKKIGIEATPKNMNDLKLQKANEEKIAKEQLESAKELAVSLEQMPVVVKIKAGEGGKTFGSVSTKEIAAAMKEQHGVELDKKKPVVMCGDMNVAHQEIDLKNPKANRKNPGFTDEERGCFQTLLDHGFVDSFRFLHPDKVEYSWWSYRFRAREKNTGWRIDYFVTSQRLNERIADAKIHTEIMGSDHCPVELDLK